MAAATAPAQGYPAYREPGDRPREYLLDVAAAAVATPRPGCAPPTWPLVEAPELVEDVCADYLRAVDQLRTTETELAAAREQYRDTTTLLEASQRETVRLQAMLNHRDDEIADLRRRLAAGPSALTEIITRLHEESERAPDIRHVPMRLVHETTFRALLEAYGCACYSCADPPRPPRRRTRWPALDDEIDTRVIDVPIMGDAR